MAVITVLSGDYRGDRYPLGQRTNVIGRAESVPIQILDDRVSRKHVHIRFEMGTNRYWITDMTSRNGVFVNGVRMRTEAALNDRDRIRIGSTSLLFTEHDTDVGEAVLHRFKKAGERERRTHTGPHVDTFGRHRHTPIAIGRDRRGALVAL